MSSVPPANDASNDAHTAPAIAPLIGEPGCAVTVSVTKKNISTKLCFVIGANQAQPWLDSAVRGLRRQQSVEVENQGTVTLEALTQPKHPEDIALTRQSLLQEAEKLRVSGNEAFKAAKDFKAYKKAALTYNRALDFVRRAGGDKDVEARIRSNLALCALRTSEWGPAVMQCDAVLDLSPGNAKALYRRALALVEMDMFVRALADLREAHFLYPGDAVVKKELDRVEAESKKTVLKRRQQFAEVYNVMPQSPIFADVIPS